MKIVILNLVATLLFMTQSIYSQSEPQVTSTLDSLNQLSSQIWKQKNDSTRLHASEMFFYKFQSVLQRRRTEGIPCDSVTGITRIASDDGALRIFTWNVPFSNGTNRYFGFIQIETDTLILIPLRSGNNEPANFATKQLALNEWYGALYYKLIQVNLGNYQAYTLLGWDGYTSNSNRKIIEILQIDKNGNIKFGMPVFKTESGIKSRIILEYAENANALLRYDYQTLKIEKGKKIKKVDTWLIVMDRLVPIDPSMSSVRKYYVPAGDMYDGYFFKDGYWILVEDIEVANKK